MSVSNMIQLDNGSVIGTLMPFKFRNDLSHCFDREKILKVKVKDQINAIINSQGWFFQTSSDKLNLGDPYIKISNYQFKLKPNWTVEDTFKYWESNRIDIDCLIMFNLILIYYLKNEIGSVEDLRPVMDIDVSCGLVNTGIHSMVGCTRNQLYPLGDSETQSKMVNG